MDYDEYFQEMDVFQKAEADSLAEQGEQEVPCCKDHKNHMQGLGVILCKVCQDTITNIIDTPEWKQYSSGGKTSDGGRCGLPVNGLLPQSSLGTSVSFKGRNSATNKIGMYQRWNSMPYKERSLYKVFNEIDGKCLGNGLPRVISVTAKSLYRIISETKISRGSNRVGIIAACVYNACKECGVPRSINELSDIFGIETKVMTKGCKNYVEIMRMSKTDISRIQDIKSVGISDFIGRFCHNLKISERDTAYIMRIAELCEDLNLLNDNTPPSMAAGCIYRYVMERDLPLTKTDIKEVTKISEVTINKCYKKLLANEIISDLLKQS
jgi:transcription initiation factor TFIIB